MLHRYQRYVDNFVVEYLSAIVLVNFREKVYLDQASSLVLVLTSIWT